MVKSIHTDLSTNAYLGKASKTRVHVGSAREYVNEYQQFGEGRELSDCVPVSGVS